MVNLVRKHQKVFAGNASNNGQFGSLQATNPILDNDPDVIQGLAAYEEGLDSAVISGEALPPLEEIQSLHYQETYQIAYGFQKGIPEYIAALDYYIGDLTREVGGSKIYESITDNNTGNALTDVANWKIWDVTANKINTPPQTATISSGAITYTGSYMIIDTEGAAASDDLETISGGVDGDRIRISIASNARNIIIKENTGNIRLFPANDITLDFQNETIDLQYDASGSQWTQVARGVGLDFSSNDGVAGYRYYPNSQLTQWIRGTVGTTPATFNFLLPFADNLYGISCVSFNSSAPIEDVGVNNPTTTGINVVASTSNVTFSIVVHGNV